MADEWFYSQNNQSLGPVSPDVLRSMMASGTLSAQNMVWRNGMPNWAPASTVPELGFAVPPSPYGTVAAPPSPYGAPQPAMHVGYYAASPYATVPYAGFWLRFVAVIIDQIILFFIGMAIGFVVGFLLGLAMAGSPRSQMLETIQLVANLVGVVVGWLYFAIQESSAAQATFGKRCLDLRVTNLAGQRITFGQATGRYFGKILSALILLVGFMMAGFTERKQALHDMLAGTLVIRGR